MRPDTHWRLTDRILIREYTWLCYSICLHCINCTSGNVLSTVGGYVFLTSTLFTHSNGFSVLSV